MKNNVRMKKNVVKMRIPATKKTRSSKEYWLLKRSELNTSTNTIDPKTKEAAKPTLPKRRRKSERNERTVEKMGMN